MAIILPAAPKNFYDPSLDTLKAKLDATNGSTKGQFSLITAAPDDIENAWSFVGVAGDTSLLTNRGTYVIGHADISTITGPVQGPQEATNEFGYKLQFGEVTDIPIYIDGTGTSTAVVKGIALVEGVDLFANGTNDHVKYILAVDDITISDGSLVKIPPFEIIINFGEIVTIAVI